jgi:hypothetical protein
MEEREVLVPFSELVEVRMMLAGEVAFPQLAEEAE